MTKKVVCDNCGMLVDPDDAIMLLEPKKDEGLLKSVFSFRDERWICKDCHEKKMNLKNNSN